MGDVPLVGFSPGDGLRWNQRGAREIVGHRTKAKQIEQDHGARLRLREVAPTCLLRDLEKRI